MRISSRIIRRVIIAGVFLAVFALTGLGLKKVTTQPATCIDGIMNGQEEGVDCGLYACNKYCEPDLEAPKVSSTKLIEAGDKDYDFVAVIENPHPQFGASEVSYELNLYNGGPDPLQSDSGVFYILPGQTKYLVLTHLTTQKDVKKIDFKITSARWQKIDTLEGMNFIVRDKEYSSAGVGTALDVVIKNDSDFDFDRVDADVVLFDSIGKIVAVHHSDVRTFGARTERAIHVVWPFNISGSVSKIEVYPSTNLFENSNFIKAYGSEVEKFQEYR